LTRTVGHFGDNSRSKTAGAYLEGSNRRSLSSANKPIHKSLMFETSQRDALKALKSAVGRASARTPL